VSADRERPPAGDERSDDGGDERADKRGDERAGQPGDQIPPVSDAERRRASADRLRQRDSAVDEAIKRAQQDGAFDDLPGKGKPLTWRDDTHAGDMALAFHMMANAGFTPDWIERGRELRARADELESGLAAWEAWWNQQRDAAATLPAESARGRRNELLASAALRVDQFRKAASELNERIDRYNLTVPVPTARMARIDVDRRVASLEQVG
jgi:hypothetical protein